MTHPERTTPVFIAPQEPEQPSPASQAASNAAHVAPTGEAPTPYTKPPRHEDPTRYGDWELSGKCVDF